MQSCTPIIRQSKLVGDFVDGSIEFSNCPKSGIVGIYYDGSCAALGPGEKAVVKEFNIDKKGSLKINMKYPVSCLKPA